MDGPDDDKIDASCEGRSDYVDGVRRDDCPYKEGTALHRFWLWGWDYGAKYSGRLAKRVIPD